MGKKSKVVYIAGSIVIGIITVLGILAGLIFSGLLDSSVGRVVFSSFSAEKVYDGTPLTSSEWKLTSGTLKQGHTAEAVFTGEQTLAGSSNNTFDVHIYDANGADVTDEYKVTTTTGKLTVTKKEIEIRTFDASKDYDGTVLKSPEYEAIGLLEGHEAKVTVTGKISVPGEKDNTFIVLDIVDASGKSVKGNYDIKAVYGKLIIGSNGGNSGNSGGLSEMTGFEDMFGAGGFSAELSGKGGGGVPKQIPLYEVISDVSGKVYFKEKSMGDYLLDASGEAYFATAPTYQGATVNPMQFSYSALSQNATLSGIKITKLDSAAPYVMPYFTELSSETDLNDSYITKDLAEYSLSYAYTWDFSAKQALPSQYSSQEEAYKQFVKQNYLNLPESTRAAMLQVIDKNDLYLADPDIINKVADLVSNYVDYSFKYSYEGDIAVYFFTKAETGICQHYATAATALFRALGIPARYTVGITGDVVAGEETVIETPGHAWVEVYVDGLGWIPVEVTGGASLGTGFPTFEDSKTEIVYSSQSGSKVFDGEELTNESCKIVSGMLKPGHNAEIVFTGSQTDVGKSENTFKVTIKDEDGKDVTSEYDIKYQPGELEVLKKELTIVSSSAIKEHDGSELSNDDYDILGDLIEGHQPIIKINGSQTDVGTSKNTIETVDILDKDGNSVKGNYEITLKEGDLTILPEKVNNETVVVASLSSSKVYDGTPLTLEEISIISGEIKSGHTAKAVFTGSQTDVGTSQNLFSLEIVDSQNQEVTDQYSIELSYGNLEVFAGRIVITTGSDTKIYDSTELTCNKYEVSGTLLDGHVLEVITTGSIVNAGTSNNTFTYDIVDAESGESVAYNYDVVPNEGTLTVLYRELVIISVNDTKVYDAIPLKNPQYTIQKGLLTIHEEKVTVTGFIVDVGVADNEFEVDDIIDKTTKTSVLQNYQIVKVYGELKVTPRPIIIKTASALKEYDGTPLTNPLYEIPEGLIGNHTETVEVTGTITEIGRAQNDGKLLDIVDGSNQSVLSNYKIIYDFGELVVIEKLDGDDDDDNDDDNDDNKPPQVVSGGSSKEDSAVSTDGLVEPIGVDFYLVNSTANGTLYLKERSFGDYGILSGSRYGWKKANDYPNANVNALQYSYSSAMVTGTNSAVTITKLDASAPYVTPYYTDFSSELNLSDVCIIKDDIYYTLNYASGVTVAKNAIPTEILMKELAYRKFVKQNYLSLPQSTKTAMNKVIADNNLSASDGDIINKVKALVSGYVPYSYTYHYEGDIATYFFTQATSGICQHYATAATALFRALGIPARYVVGYRVDGVKANIDIVQNSIGHAWVEVYVDGFGWVSVEVTGAGGSGGSDDPIIPDDDEDDDEEEEIGPSQIMVKPVDIKEKGDVNTTISYTKTKLEIKGAVDSLPKNYTYMFIVEGTQVGLGRTVTEIVAFNIFDEDENDVTHLYDIVYKTGEIIVYCELVVKPFDVEQKGDTNTVLNYNRDTLSIKDKETEKDFSFLAGCSYTFTVDGTQEGYGKTTTSISAFNVFNDKGEDITDCYEITFDTATLHVYDQEIKVVTKSFEWVYDGQTHSLSIDEVGNYSFIFVDNRELLLGHSFDVRKFSSSIKNAGSASNVLDFDIVDELGNKVTDYYKINYSSLGKLKVTPREIVITAGSKEVYIDELNGEPLTCEEYEIVLSDGSGENALAIGDSIGKIIFEGSISKVGRTTNNITEFTIVDAEGKDVTSSYKVQTESGMLKISARK